MSTGRGVIRIWRCCATIRSLSGCIRRTGREQSNLALELRDALLEIRDLGLQLEQLGSKR